MDVHSIYVNGYDETQLSIRASSLVHYDQGPEYHKMI